jgi:dTDP-6-deoxy-L-talose 4-dehydrogenase [NAD(P)+]
MSEHGRAVVLGGTGFVGRHICVALARWGFRTTAVARRVPPSGPVPFRALDIASPPPAELAAELLRCGPPDVLVNATGSIWGHTDDQMWDVAAAPTLRLLDALELMPQPPRVVHLGSVLEYGHGAAGAPVGTADHARPVSAYGRAKLAATRAVLDRMAAGTLTGMVLRVANLAGPGSPEVSLLGRVADRLVAARGRPAVVELDPLLAHRDYVDVRDVADAVLAAAISPLSGVLVDIGRGESVPVRLLVDLLIARSQLPAVVVERAGDRIGHSVEDWIRVDIGAAERLLGWRPRRSLVEAVDAYWNELAAGLQGRTDRRAG